MHEIGHDLDHAQVGDATIELLHGDITTVAVDAVVTAANESLLGGGGVDGAIHRAAGPTLLAECLKIGWCETGQAVITSAGLLPARYVIHTVGPIWEGGDDEPELLAGAYRNSLHLAEEHDLSSIAFPAISTGTYGNPIEQAARIALETTVTHLRSGSTLRRILFVLFTEDDLEVYRRALVDVLMVSRETTDRR